jgi:hypothetical protein
MAANVEGFSVSHAAILDGTTGADATGGDIYAVRSGSIELNTDSYDNTGDDTVLSTWNWINYATVSIQSGYIPFELVALLTGSELTKSGTGTTAGYEMPLWEEGTENTAPKPMIIRIPSKDADGNQRNLDFVLYKVQFSPMSFDGPSYKQGLLTNYTGRALLSEKDEKGQALDKRAIGRLLSYTV